MRIALVLVLFCVVLSCNNRGVSKAPSCYDSLLKSKEYPKKTMH